MPEEFPNPDLVVAARILEALWRNNGPMRPTQLQRSSDVNYERLKRYLDLFVSRGWVRAVPEKDGGTLYELTREGYDMFAMLARSIERFFGRAG